MRVDRLVSAVLLPLLAGVLAAGPAADPAPNQNGPLRLVAASWLGGPERDELVGVAITPGGHVLLAGNGADYRPAGVQAITLGEVAAVPDEGRPAAEAGKEKKAGKERSPAAGTGFLAWLGADGTKVERLARFPEGTATLRKLKLDSKGNVYVLGESRAGLALAGTGGRGTFIVRLGSDGPQAAAGLFHAGAIDFDVDMDGALVVLSKAKITRYTADGKAQWTATWKAHGDNRPGAVAVVPQSGITAVVGYGMTHTGKEPYKDPYAYGFDRAGKQVWALWNPEPGREKGTQFGGNGLMADTAGHGAVATPGGKLLVTFFADGGNTVCTRDPADPDRKLAPEVFAGVHQASPGHGFRGASNTSVIFRIDPASGRLEKGTWLTAWLSPARANALFIRAAAADAAGRVFVAGNSAYGCPTKEPWFAAAAGGYQGGGFLAVFDADFRLLQSRYFPGSSLEAVAVRGPQVAIAGAAAQYESEKTRAAVPAYRPLQKGYGGGARDGYLALFRQGKE